MAICGVGQYLAEHTARRLPESAKILGCVDLQQLVARDWSWWANVILVEFTSPAASQAAPSATVLPRIEGCKRSSPKNPMS